MKMNKKTFLELSAIFFIVYLIILIFFPKIFTEILPEAFFGKKAVQENVEMQVSDDRLRLSCESLNFFIPFKSSKIITGIEVDLGHVEYGP